MAIQTASTIKVPMEVQMQIKNSVNEIKKVSDEMQKQFKNVDLSSAFGKQFTKLKEQITRNFADIDASLLGTELFDDADYKRVIASIGKINKAIQNLRVHGTGATAADLGLDVSAIEEANKALDELKKKKREAAKVSVGELAPSELKEFDKHKAQTGFKSTATYKQNITTLANKRGLTKVAYEALNTPEQAAERNAASDALSKAQAAYAAAQEYYTTAENNYRNAQAELSKQSQLRETARVGSAFAKIPYFTGGGRQKSNIITDYMEALKAGAEQTAGGNFTEAGASFVKMVASWLNYTDDDIAKLMKKKASTVVTQLQSALSETLNKNVFAFGDKARAAAKGYDASAYSAADTLVSTTQQEFEQKKVDLETATNNQTDAQTKYDQVVRVYNETQELLELLDKQINSLRELSEQFDKDINTTYDGKIKELEQAAIDAEQAQTKEVRALLESLSLAAGSETKGAKGTEQSYFDAKALNAAQQAAAQAAREREVAEADAFKQNLQQSIKHWMSAQQIINFVKDGIRQAYQDIKGLDAAMTNIAVVTDMSVGDLWGKINDYMAIAQQYGVTTQGVYEVSQLYYQQGLGTAEVMAATTETLKMARIAGMDYAEAADAMTVAIRAFKMEMSDAQHVTDVYSKVAAVTASDTEELAIAMSKTASSAESVGSSFENTTAMLAVMIETTRESAQNLGSALKSIISRYGEMKVGLTVDSEGEEIDYNKTDTALKSVGISLKDAQGQFRDFDEVIFELSQKWDSLDKNTQRYLATIMAGNRQQSRFIALVDNWERLDEVANSAQDSEDAGLIQYAKTLDSLESKLANVKTSFQQFYMSVFNGNFFKAAVDLINNFITSLNRVGPLLGSINLLQLISQIKLIGSLLVNVFQKSLSTASLQINNWKKSFTEGGWTTIGETIGEKIGAGLLNALKEAGVKIPDTVEEAAVTNAPAAGDAKNQVPATPVPTQQQIAFTQASALQMQTGLLFNKNFGSAGQYFGNIQNIIGKDQKVQGQQNYGYKGAAQAILANKDAYDASAVQWAESVNQSGQKWSDVVKLSTIEEKAAAAEVIMKEMASADAILAKNQAGATQVGSLMNSNFNTASNYIITGAKEFANIIKGAAPSVKQSSEDNLWQRAKNSKPGQWIAGHKQQIGQGAATIGLALSSAGMMMDQSTMAGYNSSTALQAAGGALSAVGQALTGNYVGAIITGITTVSTMFTRISERAKVELENAEKAASEANIKRAEAKNEASNLETTINNLKKLQEARYDSAEAEQAFIDASNTAFEQFPQLTATFDETGNAIIDVINNAEQAEWLLIEARQASAEASTEAAAAELKVAQTQLKQFNTDYQNSLSNAVAEGAAGVPASGSDFWEYDLEEQWIRVSSTMSDRVEGGWYSVGDEKYGISQDFIAELDERYAAAVPTDITSIEEAFEWVKTLDKWLKSDYNFQDNERSIIEGLFDFSAYQFTALVGEDPDANNYIEAYGSYLQQIQKDAQLHAAVIAGQTAVAETYANQLLTIYDPAENASWRGLEGAKSTILSQSVTAAKAIQPLEFNENGELTDNSSQAIATQVVLLEQAYTEFADSLNSYQTEAYNTLQSSFNKGQVSLNEYLTSLTKLDSSFDINNLDNKDNNAALVATVSSALDGYITTVVRMMKDSNILDFQVYEDWLSETNRKDSAEAQQEYLNYLKNTVKATGNTSLANIIFDSAATYAEAYINTQNELATAIADNTTNGRKALTSRKQWLTDINSALVEYDGVLFGLEDSLKTELYTLLTADDLGTYDWGEQVLQFAKNNGLENLEIFTNLDSILYENYQIRLQTLIDSASTITESLDGLLEKQEKGFTWEEAQSTLKQLQKLEPETTWSDIFETDAQGMIILKDFAATSNKLYQASLKDLQKEKRKNDQILTSLTSTVGSAGKNKQRNAVKDELTNFNTATDTIEEARSIANSFDAIYNLDLNENVIEELAQAIVTGEVNSFDAILTFFQNIGEQIDDATDVFTKQNQAMQASNAFGEYTKTFEKAGNFKTLSEASSISDFEDIWTKEALQIQQDKDATWTDDQYQQFYKEQAAAIKGAEFDTFGNLKITDVQAYTDFIAKEQGIQIGSQEYYQILNQNLQNLSDAQQGALDMIEDLGAAAAAGEDEGLYASIFKVRAERFGYQETEKTMAERVKDAATLPKGQRSDLLLSDIAGDLIQQGYTDITGIDDPRVLEAYDKLIAGYRDGINENILEYIDLASKSAEGLELTETEALRMGELSDLLGTQLTQELYNAVTANASDTVGKYASIINAVTQADLPWGQIEDIVRDSYTNMIDTIVAQMRSGDTTMSADKWATLETISDTAGIFDNGTLAEIFTAAQKEGITIKQSEFANAFRWDDTVNGLVVNSAAAVKELFGDAGDEYVDAILKANNDFTLQKAIDFSKYQDTLNDLFSDITEVTLEDVQSAYDEIHSEGAFAQSGQLELYQQAIAEAENGNTEMLIEHLRVLAAEAHIMGYDIDFSELEAALEDAQISLIDRLVGFLEAGIEGTLSATEHADLKERYNLSEGIQTAQGIQLTREDQQKMFGAVYGQARISGNLQGIEDTLIEMLPDGIVSENLSEAIDEAEKAAGGLKNRTEDTASAAWDYYDALVAAQKALMLSEDAYDFTFMEQEPTDGLTANFDNFKDQIETIQDAFEAFKSKEAIDYKDFYNMMDFINNASGGALADFSQVIDEKALPGLAKLQTLLFDSGLTYEQFVNSVVKNTDEWGKVDIGSVAAELGISVEAAMTAMSKGMTDSLKEVAKSQIEYLEGLEAMLEAMVALNGLDVNADLKFDITIRENDEDLGINFKDFQAIYDYYDKLPDKDKKTFITQVATQFDDTDNVNASVLWSAFTKDGDFTQVEATMMKGLADIWNTNMDSNQRQAIKDRLVTLTQEQYQWLAEAYATNDGNIDFAGLWQRLLDPEEISASFGAAVQQAFAGDTAVQLDSGIFTINPQITDNAFTVDTTSITSEAGLTEEIKAALTQQLNQKLNKKGAQVDTITWDAKLGKIKVTVKDFDEKIQSALQQYVWNWQTDGTATRTLTLGNGETVDIIYTPGAVGFKVNLPNGMSWEEMRQQIANDWKVNLESVQLAEGQTEPKDGQKDVLFTVDTSTATDNLTLVSDAVTKIVGLLEKGINFVVDSTEVDNVTTKLEALQDTTYTTTVKVNYSGLIGGLVGKLFGGKTEKPTEGDTSVAWMGTMNDLHGPAFADGSIGKLYSGAQLANKTLVGELGPELAVYDGQYHMLGANGAEFVKLPDDAIVFNHLQTAGILNGQMNVRGQALVNGNVSGPALAGGAAEALQAVRRAKSVWQGLINDLSAADLVGAAEGGGGDDTKAHIEDLEEWYNLSRKIANVEQEINNIIAERENMADGHEYLRSLRLQQELLQEQIGYQETLLNYQELQLKRQADVINTDKLWSQFIHVDETGLLQYNKGNETNGGKGALEVLQDLNEMSGKDQIAFLDKIGYKYTTTDGKELEGSELVAKFFEELQKQIDEYDALYDTVHETNETIENLKTNIEEINQEVIDNQLELETEIYDLIVEAWEKEIEKMEEYADKVEEANQKYIDGLQDALDAEKDLYNKNQSIDDRETLQRQLALLRRSGGSASEIADLEAELDNMLKDEYFANQQEAIDNIQKVNEAQLEALQQQIQLEEDALAFQQEHGLIWNQVNEIMQGGFDSMMNFFTAKDNEFFEASALAQIEKLDDWAKRVGIYDEDQAHQKHEDKAAANYWDNNAIWSDASLAGMQQVFNSMADGDKKAIKDTFLNAYANAKMSGKSEEEAKAAGINSITSALNAEKERQDRAVQQSTSNTVQNTPAPPTTPEPENKFRYVYMYGNKLDENGETKRVTVGINTDSYDYDKIRRIIKGYQKSRGIQSWVNDKLYGFSEGGLVDYTGPAIVHGTPARPEGFLNAEQTAQIRDALAISGDSTLLNILRSVASQLKVVSGAVSNSVSNNRSIEIAQGAVQVQVGTLANSYDVEDLSNDIMGRIVAIADKSTNRSVGRR